MAWMTASPRSGATVPSPMRIITWYSAPKADPVRTGSVVTDMKCHASVSSQIVPEATQWVIVRKKPAIRSAASCFNNEEGLGSRPAGTALRAGDERPPATVAAVTARLPATRAAVTVFRRPAPCHRER